MSAIEKYLGKQNPHLHWYHDKNRIIDAAVNNGDIDDHQCYVAKIILDDYWDDLFDVVKRKGSLESALQDAERNFSGYLKEETEKKSKTVEYFNSLVTEERITAVAKNYQVGRNVSYILLGCVAKKNEDVVESMGVGHANSLLSVDRYLSISSAFKNASLKRHNIPAFVKTLTEKASQKLVAETPVLSNGAISEVEAKEIVQIGIDSIENFLRDRVPT